MATNSKTRLNQSLLEDNMEENDIVSFTGKITKKYDTYCEVEVSCGGTMSGVYHLAINDDKLTLVQKAPPKEEEAKAE